MMTVSLASAALLLLASALGAQDAPGPHDRSDDPRRCPHCHVSADAIRPEAGSLGLLADSVDSLCTLCHRAADCCRTGQDHYARGPLDLGISHPSDLDAEDVAERHRPRTLPLFQGRITCHTCHLHDRADPRDYKLLRKTVFAGERPDWTGLCKDCHAEY